MKKRKILCLLLALLTALSLFGCGEQRPVEGKYILRVLWTENGLQPVDGSSGELQLAGSGRGRISYGGLEGSLRWSLKGSSLSLKLGEKELSGSLDGDLIVLSFDGMEAGFYREGRELPSHFRLPEAEESYYGWWRISGSQGSLPDTWIDCCAALEGERLTLWDEDGSRDKPMAEILLRYDYDGSLISRSGYFWGTALGEADFRLQDDGSGLLSAAGSARDMQGAGFEYEIHLRPWGGAWPEEESEPDMLPYFYSDWYLPLIKEGQPMPDKIEP